MPSSYRESPRAPISLLFFSAPPADTPSAGRIAAVVAAAHAIVLAALFWTTTLLPNTDLPVGANPLPAGLDTDFTVLLIGSGEMSAAPERPVARERNQPVRTQPVTPVAPEPTHTEPTLLGRPTVLLPAPPDVIPARIPAPAPMARAFDAVPTMSPPVVEAAPPRGAEPSSAHSNGNGNGHISGNGARTGFGNGDGADLSLDELAREPRFTPFTQGPELINRAEVKAFLQRRYPPSMSARGLGGRAVLWLLIDKDGGIRKAVLLRSSGSAVLDDAAMESIDRMEFRPAINKGRRVNVWVQLPVAFRPDW